MENKVVQQQLRASTSSFDLCETTLSNNVPNFVKKYEIIGSCTLEPKWIPSKSFLSFKLPLSQLVTPSPKKQLSSNLFATNSRTNTVDVQNLNNIKNDIIFDKYFESTEMKNLFCPCEDESVQASII